MDIEEIKKYAKNKIEADDITKQVRKRIKETAWEKQNLREGFTETFKPLISQFEKPEDPKTKNIFTQNQEMLRNQLALREGLKGNQKAITDGFSDFERLADMRELPVVEEDEEDEEGEEAQAPIAEFDEKDINKNLDSEKDIKLLYNNGYTNLPYYYLYKDISEISKLIEDVKKKKNLIRESMSTQTYNFYNDDDEGYELARAKREKPKKPTLENIDNYNILSKYLTNLQQLKKYKEKIKTKSGSGIFYNNPEKLLKRFELLNGSLAAGNNGVLPEYIQIAHLLRDIGVFNNKQLNKLLRKII